jgi:F-type H+-transporting ATPase subunit a
MSHGIEVVLSATQIGTFFGIPITNALIMSWTVMAILILFAVIMRSRIKMVPSRFQALLEWAFEYLYDYIAEALESRKLARIFFPLLLTIFIFIFAANMMEFIPGIGSIGFFHGDEFVPIMRTATTDLNLTLALAIIACIVVEVTGIMVIGGTKYAGKFLNLHSPIGFVVGIIEFFSELARLVAFSFRLFGNIFAGEVLIAVAIYFAPYVGPVPFMAYEVFVGFIQAAIFSLLTLFFIKVAIMEAH